VQIIILAPYTQQVVKLRIELRKSYIIAYKGELNVILLDCLVSETVIIYWIPLEPNNLQEYRHRRHRPLNEIYSVAAADTDIILFLHWCPYYIFYHKWW